MLSREEIVLKLEELKQEVKTYEKILQILDKSDLVQRTGPAMRFYRARPSSAAKMILHEKGPQPQDKLMEELRAGGIAIGKKRGMHNTRIAIERTLKTGALKQVGDLIGLPEWSDEKFKG
jgi:hypothetical protein